LANESPGVPGEDSPPLRTICGRKRAEVTRCAMKKSALNPRPPVPRDAQPPIPYTMTRTARSTSLRAINKDRSESKSGHDKSLRKNGAGGHNWGSIDDERQLEDASLYDEDLEEESRASDALSSRSDSSDNADLPTVGGAMTQEEREKAKKLRKNFQKAGEIDLSAIARSSAARAA